MVARQVMKQHQHQPVVIRLVISQVKPQQRRLAHVDSELARIEARVQLFSRIASRRFKFDLLDLKRRLAPNHLHRFRQPFPNHRCAQNVVTDDHRLQGRDIGVQPFPVIEAKWKQQQVWIALSAHQVVEKDTFLQRCEGVDVLHVGGAARNADNPSSPSCRQFQQGQYLRA